MKMNPLVPLGTFLSSRLPLTAFFHCKAIRYNRAFCNVGAPPGWKEVKLIIFTHPTHTGEGSGPGAEQPDTREGGEERRGQERTGGETCGGRNGA